LKKEELDEEYILLSLRTGNYKILPVGRKRMKKRKQEKIVLTRFRKRGK
jgi:hypothetical protein